MKVSGVVLLEPAHPEAHDAVLRVRLLDVSRVDAPSVELALTVIPGVTHRAGERRTVPFVLEAGDVAERTSLSVAAHLRRNPADDGIRRGDLITTTSNPVPTTGAEGLVLTLQEV